MEHHLYQTQCGYSSGHPWYYLLGGRVLPLKQIKAETKACGYQGYLRDDIAQINKMIEPKRSAKLRALRMKVIEDLQSDISGYRKRALELHRYRAANPLLDRPISCADIHTNISLKHNHLVNGFAHLITLDNLLNQQGDLFAL